MNSTIRHCGRIAISAGPGFDRLQPFPGKGLEWSTAFLRARYMTEHNKDRKTGMHTDCLTNLKDVHPDVSCLGDVN